MRYLVLSLLTFLYLSAFTQTTEQFNLIWTTSAIVSPNGEKQNILSFNGSNINHLNNLPEFSNLQKTGAGFDQFSVELVDTEFKLLSSIEMEVLKNNSLPNLIIPTATGVTIRKTPHQLIQFIPIRKNTLTGQIEKLVKFKLRLKKQNQTKAQLKTKNYTSSSVLANGKWVKISVDTTAIHKITYDELIDMGIENPAQVRVYGYGGMLSKLNSDNSPDDLPNIPIHMNSGNDGIFNSGDYILFYAQGPKSWRYNSNSTEFEHQNHLYSNKACYFLTSDLGSAITVSNLAPESNFNTTVTSFNDYMVFDKDKINLLESGRLWLGEKFDITTSYQFNFNFSNLIKTEPVKVTYHLAARSSSTSKFNIVSNGNLLDEVSMPSVNTGSYTANFASLKSKTFNSFTPNEDTFSLSVEYEKSSASSVGWMDYLRINARRKLILTGDQMAFRDINSVTNGNIAQFRIENISNNTLLWDVSNTSNILQIPLQFSGNTGTCNLTTSVLREFIAFNPEGNFPSPTVIGEVQNQNLHALDQTDMLIIAPAKFISYANQIADHHRNEDQLKVNVITPDKIYNEYSSGVADVSAIRNFVKMFYDRATTENDMIKYLLLFGDGSFDNKGEQESNTNQILTYQSENSISPTQSFVTDDFFGLLDNEEGEADGMVDIGIGRLPVNTSEEAQIVTNKILNYNKSPKGDWHSMLCFIGDDEDNKTHMRDANRLAVKVENEHPEYRIERIFLDDYEQITSSAGQRYPDVNRNIAESVNKGTLIMNYTGHGNENGLAHEQILMIDDILSWQNTNKLPLFMTATCEFSRFDNYKKKSAGEIIFLRDNGGGIGLFTTTRLVFSSPNFTLNQNFYDHVFERNSNGDFNRLGDIMRKTKNATSSGINKRNFTLLGDPALQLKYPEHKAVTLKLNDVDITQPTDSIKALSEIKISGELQSNNGSLLNTFNGTIFPIVFDKAIEKSTKGNDENPFEYTEQSNIIFKGKARVNAGKFSFSFFVPKDINYQYGNGKILYYANGGNSDAAGYNNTIVIGGTNPNAGNDQIGPEIELFMDDEQFLPGGATDNTPLLLAIVQDESGINTVGNSIGHNITAILDQKTDSPIELNDFYESDLDNYKKGKITYQLSELEKGEHELDVKVWDNVNNSSESNINFVVSDDAGLVISHVLNYPNPFTTKTGFYFEQNQGATELDILIQVLTVSGKLIKSIETTITPSNSRVGPIEWDGKDDFGNSIGRGVYFYRVKVRASDGKVVNKFQKLVILK